ncbi:MAG: PEGA domain-containing protein [Polyangiaceae bacterium]
MRTTLIRAAVLAMCLVCPAARADDVGGAKAEAIRKYEEGSKAFQEKRYKDAIDLFLEADAAVPNADLAYNTSLAYESMGDAANALRWAREYLRRAPTADDRADVEKRIGKLEQRLKDKGVQQVTVLTTPAAATVFIDDRAVGVTPWTGELLPGNHRVEVRLEGYDKSSQIFELRPDRALDVTVPLTATKAPTTPTPNVPTPTPTPAPVPAPDEKRGTSVLVPVGAAIFGAGLVGIGAAIGLEVARAGAEEDASLAPVQIDAQASLEEMESYQLGARVAVGLGSAAAATGIALFIAGLASPSKTPRAGAATVWFGCDAHGCGGLVGGAF